MPKKAIHSVCITALRLDLCLLCRPKTPVRKTLDVWPPLPIEILSDGAHDDDIANIIAALEHRDRIRKIWFYHLPSLQWEQLAPMMQEPFPALTFLQLWTGAPALPDMFLGGSAPRLQSLKLLGISFPGLPRLLLSAINLSQLSLWQLPHSRYISPKAMVTGLFSLTRLTHHQIQIPCILP